MKNIITFFLVGLLYLLSNQLVIAQNITVDVGGINDVVLELENKNTNNVVSSLNNTFYDITDGDYLLSASKESDYMEGVSTLDIVLIQRHILKLKEFSNPYSLFAADVRKDQRINALDVIHLRKLILGIYDRLPENDSWVFGEGNQVFSSNHSTILADGLEEEIAVSMSGNDVFVSFEAIKIGDVDFTINFKGTEPENIINHEIIATNENQRTKISPISFQRRTQDSVKLRLEEVVAVGETHVCLSVTVDNFEEIEGFQFPLSWDETVLAYESHDAKMPNYTAVNNSNTDEGELIVLWTEATGNNVSLDDGSEIFEICFTILDQNAQPNSVSFTCDSSFDIGFFGLEGEIPFCFIDGGVILGASCLPNYIAPLNDIGEVTIVGSDLYIGEEVGDVFLINGAMDISYDCSDIGQETIELSRTNTNGTIETCEVVIDIVDVTPPTVKVKDGMVITLDANLKAILEATNFEDGYDDTCSDNISLTLSPKVLTCDMGNPAKITLTATDEYGNSSSVDTWVDILYPEPAVHDIACYGSVNVNVFQGGQVEVFPKMFLAGTLLTCPAYYKLSLSDVDGSNVQSDNLLDLSDLGKSYRCTITDPIQGTSCWGTLTVTTTGVEFTVPKLTIDHTEEQVCIPVSVKHFNAITSFQFSLSWNSSILKYKKMIFPSGSPVSAQHTAQLIPGEVNVSWNSISTLPIDLLDDQVLFDICYDVLGEPGSFSEIEFKGELRQQVVDGNFNEIDAIFNNGRLNIGYINLSFICDSLAWDTPFGNCDSGHSPDDDVEWPADVYVDNSFVSPIGLSINATVNPNNVQPRLFNNVIAYGMTYIDDITIVNDSLALINRLWSIASYSSGYVNSYLQVITVNATLSSDFVCVYRPIGDGLKDVNVINSFSTGDDGCVVLNGIVDGTIITPNKSSRQEEGLDMADMIILYKGILKMIELTPYQLIAGDINNDGTISSLDVILLEKLINGEYNLTTSVWKFVDASYVFGIVDINNLPSNYPEELAFNTSTSNNFIAMKMGDLDNSYDQDNLVSNKPKTAIVIKDEILNKGESYSLPIRSKDLHAIEGIQFSLNFDAARLKVKNIASDILPEFSMDEHVIIDNSYISLLYSIDLDNILNGGIMVSSDEPIFHIEFDALNDGILNEMLGMEISKNNILKARENDVAYTLELEWEAKLFNSIDNKNYQVNLDLYPQPASDFITVKWNGKLYNEVTYRILDIMGKDLIEHTLIDSSIDVSMLNDGLYILELYQNDEKIAVEKLIITR